jgi:NAD+ diphosphatase
MDNTNHFGLKSSFTPTPLPGKCNIVKTLWFTFRGDEVLVSKEPDGSMSLLTDAPENLGLQTLYKRYFGVYGDTACAVAEIPVGDKAPPATCFKGLRPLFGKIGDELFNLTGRASQILQHHREHRFCSKCGTPMEDKETELARSCPACSFISFPRISPAVIMAVSKGNRILLGRSPQYPEGMYSTLAGFVESGETLEETVKREVQEETGIHVNNIKYMASQAWPFPHSIMIGFTAEYESGTIQVDDDELEDARWFSVKDLPKLPSKITIARLLIDSFIQKWS